MRHVLLVAVLFTVGILTVAGCSRRLQSEITQDLQANRVKVIDLQPALSVQIELSSKDGALFSAVLVSKEDGDKVAADLDAFTTVRKLAFQDNITAGRLSSPKAEKKTQWCVLLTSSKNATVTAKITGQ